MGNMMKKSKSSGNQGGQQQPGVIYAPYPPAQQPMQPIMQGQPPPMYMQQPQMQPQPAPVFVQQPQYIGAPATPQVRPMSYPQAQPQQPMPPLRPTYPSAPSLPPLSGSPPFSLPQGPNQNTFENDAFLSTLTGWSPHDIDRLRQEFLHYTNAYGVIDREGFRKLYVASLLNMTWDTLERDAEQAFRNFDVNRTGSLDFNEYITACSRLSRENNVPFQGTQAPPPMQPAPLGPGMSGSYPAY